VTLGILAFGVYYLRFVERETSYFSDRNARLIVGLAAQLRESVDATSEYAKQAAGLKKNEVPAIFRFDPAERSPMPAAVFTKIETCAKNEENPTPATAATLDRPHRYAERTANGLVLHFNQVVKSKLCADDPKTGSVITKVNGEPASLVTSSVELGRLADQIVQQSAAAVFASVFILDATGTVVYQRGGETEKAGGVKIVQIHELPERRYFGKDEVVKIGDLMAASRNTAVHIGDANYQLFTAPLRSGLVIEDPAGSKVANTPADDTWVLCGIVRESDFRTQALAISVTLISAVAAAVLLLIFSWPFLKVALISATHRLSTVDVVLLGLCGILASSILSLTVLDWLAYSNLEASADEQLEKLATGMDRNFALERVRISKQVSRALGWAEDQFTDNKPAENPSKNDDETVSVAPLEARNGNLLKLAPSLFDDAKTQTDGTKPYPYIQSFALISANGWQGIKWFMDKYERVTPIVRVATRTYFTSARDKTKDYLELGAEGGDRLAMQSVRSITTGLPEIDFGRRTDESPKRETFGQQRVRNNFPVITMTVPDALSIGHPIFPRYFGFAIIDSNGKVLFHSEDRRNTVENFFDETDRDKHLRAAVYARRDEVMNIRYWGDDYRAYVHPMSDLPWTIVTFREKRGLRTLNTEALIVTLVLILTLVGPGLMLFIAVVKLTRPRYAARWLWPDAAHVSDYADLAGIYGMLLVASMGLLALLPEGALMFLPYWFVPIVLVVTYIRIAKPPKGAKLIVMLAVICLSLLIGTLSIAGETHQMPADSRTIEPASLLLVVLIALSIVYATLRASGGVSRDMEPVSGDVVSAETPMTTTPGVSRASGPIAVLREGTTPRNEVVTILETSGVTKQEKRGGARARNYDPLKQQAQLPLAYCSVAFLLLVLTSVVPTAAFFKAAYRVEIVSFMKSVQVQFARDLQARWWRASAEYDDARGELKGGILSKRWEERLDLYNEAAFDTKINFNPHVGQPPSDSGASSAFPRFIENVLPHYSEASVITRELIHDRSSDLQWWWTLPTTSDLTLWLKPPPNSAANLNAGAEQRPDLSFSIKSVIPSNVIGFRGVNPESAERTASTLMSVILRLVVIGILLAANFWIAQFMARRVFLVDLVNPRWLTQGVLGLRHVICYPYDESKLAATENKRPHGKPDPLSGYAAIDLRDQNDYKRAEGLPQGFDKQPFEQYVLIKGLDYRFASGERAKMLRGLLERLMRNADRNIVLLPSTMSVITNALLQGPEAEEWSKVLSTFVWVSGDQLSPDTTRGSIATGRRHPIASTLKRTRPSGTRWHRVIHMFSSLFGFASYIEQIMDGRTSAERAFKDETRHDAYLCSLVQGLDSEATARDQVLEEVSERAENYYASLWHTCSHLEKIVLLQLAQTGLVNEKMKRDVRRLLARGLIRRDPRLRVMNETFRRFILLNAANTDMADELEPGFGSDTWQRFRVPLFATVLVVTLFFFVTQHELFDATIAGVTGLTAALPAFTKVLTMWGDRGSRGAR